MGSDIRANFITAYSVYLLSDDPEMSQLIFIFLIFWILFVIYLSYLFIYLSILYIYLIHLFILFIYLIFSAFRRPPCCHPPSVSAVYGHPFTSASCNKLPFQWISYFKIHLHLARLKQYPWANRPEYKERSAICDIISSRVILSPGVLTICRKFWKF